MKYTITLTIETEEEDLDLEPILYAVNNERLQENIIDALEGSGVPDAVIVDASVDHYFCPIATAYLKIAEHRKQIVHEREEYLREKDSPADDTPDPEIMAKCFKEDNDI